jgi:hypothetical protein
LLLVCLFVQVVQVYTYMLSPLMVQAGVQGGQAPAVREQDSNQQQEQPGADGHNGGVFGWQLRLVMEYADQVRLPLLCDDGLFVLGRRVARSGSPWLLAVLDNATQLLIM